MDKRHHKQKKPIVMKKNFCITTDRTSLLPLTRKKLFQFCSCFLCLLKGTNPFFSKRASMIMLIFLVLTSCLKHENLFQNINFQRKSLNKPNINRIQIKDVLNQLMTILVEGIEENSLLIAAEKKSTYMSEFPTLTLENHEGPSLFCEVRSKSESIYLQKLNIYRKKLLYPSKPESLAYDVVFHDINSQMPLHVYWGNNVYIPELEISWIDTSGIWGEPFRPAVFWLSYDNLNRFIFPESGLKADIDVKFGIGPNSWWRARFRLLLTKKLNLLNIASPTFTGRLFASLFDENTPEHQKYCLGGCRPAGAYQLSRYDYEDLPGFKRNELIEPLMWKVGGAVRVVSWGMSLLGVHVNALCEGYLNVSYAGQAKNELIFRKQHIDVCPVLGLYLNASYFNIGILIKGGTHIQEDKNYWSCFLHNFRLIVAHYTLGF